MRRTASPSRRTSHEVPRWLSPIGLVGLLLTLPTLSSIALPPSALAQDVTPPPPVIDTVILRRSNVFPDSIAATSGVFRFMNKLHVVTRPRVIRKELLFRQGQPFDSALVMQSERILRDLQLFSQIHIDTATVDGKFAVIVDTRDGWSTKPKIQFAVASDGTVTLTLGILEINLLGTGILAQAYYVKEVDRDGANLAMQWNRFYRRLTLGGSAQLLSDGNKGNWQLGAPFFSSIDRAGGMYDGFASDRRVFQFRASNPATLDSITYNQTAFINDFTGAIARKALSNGYLRFGAVGQVKQEKFILQQETGTAVPDTVTGYFGGLAEYRRDRFRQIRMFNGFGTEDVDMSTALSLTVNLAPEAFGYPETGIGAAVIAAGAVRLGSRGFLHARLDANGLFGSGWYNSAGLDSGRVVLQTTLGYKVAPRHATVLHLEGGLQENSAPGTQFDLGFTTPPRLFQPHAFVGTREAWGMFEHRWFAIDNFLNLVGIGFAGFLDYGGAWYPESDDPVLGQPARFGGNVGIGLRLGSVLSTIPNTGRLDVGYQFGDGVEGSGWAISFGAGFVYPKRVKLRTDRQPVVTATGTPTN